MTKFAVTATTKIAKITAKTIPVALLFTRSPRRIKSEDKVIFFIDFVDDSSSRAESHKDQEGKGEKTLSIWMKLKMEMTPQRVLAGLKFSKAKC